MVAATLQELTDSKLIEVGVDSELSTTKLGAATVSSSLTPEDGLFVYEELRKALQAFVMDGEMHILYTFTPVHETQASIDWRVFLREVESLNESDMRSLRLIGLKPSSINKM